MKILHTSDWHLGKLLHAVNLIPDQRYVLEQIVSMVEQERPDAVVVAGDVYDRAVPPTEAVELLDWVLTELVLRLNTPTVIIAGNHDSPDRLQFGSALLRKNGLFVAGKLEKYLEPIRVGQTGHEGFLCPLPFVEPAMVREYLQDDEITTQEVALRAMTALWKKRLPPHAPAILIAHAYVAGGAPSDSERTLSMGGADQVAADCFDGFSYVALGHLHRPQSVGNPWIRYSGSILKFSRSEIATAKSVSLVEVGPRGECGVRELPLTPRHDVREIQGFLSDIEQGASAYGNPEDFLFVKLLDTAMPVNAMSRLRTLFPNIVDIDVSTALKRAVVGPQGEPLLSLDDMTLFATFIKSVTGEDLTSRERTLVSTAMAATLGEKASS